MRMWYHSAHILMRKLILAKTQFSRNCFSFFRNLFTSNSRYISTYGFSFKNKTFCWKDTFLQCFWV